MTRARLDQLVAGLLEWPAQHPIAALVIAAACLGLATEGIRRTSADASIEALLPRGDPAAVAMGRILRNFPSADELLVLVSVPEEKDQGRGSTGSLMEFAGRLERMLGSSPDSRELVAGISYRVDEQTREFFEKVLAPAAVYYLDDQALAAARHRLTRAEMAEQISRNQAMIAAPGPAADALAKALLADPLRLHEFLVARFAKAMPVRLDDRGGAFVSGDGRSLLIRIRGARPPGDIEFAKRLTGAVTALATQANSDGLEVDIAGAYAIAAASEQAIRSDMKSSVTSSVICLQLLFVLAYRRPVRLFALAFAPVALGIVYGFGAHALYSTTVAPPTAVVGAILAGMGIDYSVHYLSHHQAARGRGVPSLESLMQTSTSLAPPLLAAWATSVLGFASVGWSSVQALRDFAVVGSLGLSGALLATLWVLPAILRLVDRGGVPRLRRRRFDLEPTLAWVRRRRKLVLCTMAALCVVMLGVVLAPGTSLEMEDDLTVMHPRPNAPLDAQAKIARRMGGAGESLLVHLSADTPESLVRLAHAVDRALDATEPRQAGVSGTFSLATLLPDPDVARQRRIEASAQQAAQVARDFRSAIAESDFAPEAYEPYARFLEQLLSGPPTPTIETLRPYELLAGSVLGQPTLAGDVGPAEALTMVLIDRPLDQRESRERAIFAIRRALGGLRGATLTGLSVIGHDTEQTIHHDLPRVVGVAAVLVIAYMLLHFRGLGAALLAALPMGFSLLAVMALMRMEGQKLNVMNLVAIPLLIGITVDYGIFVVSLARAPREASDGPDTSGQLAWSCHAIGVSAVTTILGFGTLVWTSVPAIQSLGWAVAAGVGAGLLATLLILVPICFGRTRAAT
jgi:hypothetical protein